MNAEELLSMVANESEIEYIQINPKSREMLIPQSQLIFGVYQDKDVERKYFRCPKIVGDNVDVSECFICINYVTDKEIGQYMVEDMTIVGDDITFTWLLSDNVFSSNSDSDIRFAIQIKKSDIEGKAINVLNTKPATGRCFKTLDNGEHIATEYADVILQLMTRVQNVKDGITFTPSVSSSGIISWINDGEQENPDPVNIKGPDGDPGVYYGTTEPIGLNHPVWVNTETNMVNVWDTNQNKYQPIPTVKGAPGDDYVITDDDYNVIANNVLESDSVKSAIDKSTEALNKAEEAELIAKQGSFAKAYDTYQSFITALNSETEHTSKVGQSFYIEALNIPDLWVSKVYESKQEYEYISDEYFVNTIITNGSVRVGFYDIAALETAKVDLSNFVKNTDYATSAKAGIVRISSGLTTNLLTGAIMVQKAQDGQIVAKQNGYNPIVSQSIDLVVKVGITTNTINLTDAEKRSAHNWLGIDSYAGIPKKLTIPWSPSIALTPNVENNIATLEADTALSLDIGVEDRANEWVAIISQGETAYDVTLPPITWDRGIEPVFLPNTIIEIRVFYKGDTLMGVWL